MQSMLFYFSEGKKIDMTHGKREFSIFLKNTNILKCLGRAYFQNEAELIGTQT